MHNFVNNLAHWLRAAFVGLFVLGAPVAAQVLPQLPPGVTTADAIRLFRTSPEFRDFVRIQLLSSGLTPAQMRSQLVAAGYPANLLDAFLAAEGIPAGENEEEMLGAISALGVRTAPQQSPRIPTDSMAGGAPAPRAIAEELPELALFGLDVFQGDAAAFEGLLTGPVDGSYRLGAGDRLVLLITGGVETSHEIEVTRQGFIIIPRVGQVFVNSLTLDQLRSVLYDRLGQRYSGITRSPDAPTKFDILVAQVRTQTVRIVGEVAKPGIYQIPGGGNVMTALYQAGGITERGSFRAVQVRRGAEVISEIDIYDYMLRGTIKENLALQPGDVIFVPIHGPHVKIVGEVTRPAVYELLPDETLRTLIDIAGGLTPYASTEIASIDRVLPPQERTEPGNARRVLTVNLGNDLDSTTITPMLAADSITIFPIRGPRRNSVTISGAVWQPGTYQLGPNMRLWDLIDAAGGLRPDAYQERAQIRRLRPDSTRHLVGVLLSSTGNPQSRDDPTLQESDEVTIFSRTEFRSRRYIAIQGAVRNPGTIEFTDSMTLRDAILLARGLTDDAYLLEAEISRVRPNAGGSPDSMVTIFKVPMDSSYVFDVTRPVAPDVTQVILFPHDNIFIRQQPGWEVARQVTITGEVRFPGSYIIASPDEQLSGLIARAGGVTAAAYPSGIRFIRAQDAVGRIAVDLPQVLREPGRRDDLALAPGDSIHIPRFIPTVRVEGAVNLPTSVTFVPGSGIDYYINAAGGAAHRADPGKAFVQQPNGLVGVGNRPEPGAVIIVPQKDPDDRGFLQLLPLFTMIIQVFATTATLVIALSR